MNKKCKKRGISLIVLIITIIVMLILATVIVMSLSNNNVIDKANTAVTETNLKNMEEAANIALGELILENDGKTDGIGQSEIVNKMKENGVDPTKSGFNVTYDEETGKITVSGDSDGTVNTDWVIAIVPGQGEDGGDLHAFMYIGNSSDLTLPYNTNLLVNVVEVQVDNGHPVGLNSTGEIITLNIGNDYFSINGLESFLYFWPNDTLNTITIPDGLESLLSGHYGGIFSTCSNLHQINLPSRPCNHRS